MVSHCFHVKSHVKSQVAHWLLTYNDCWVTTVTAHWTMHYYGNYMSDAES